jgi:hypothetical protein
VHVTVDLASEPPSLALVEPDDCTSFDVTVTGTGDDTDLDRALVDAGVGRTDKDEALVTVAAVRRLAAGAVGEGWDGRFEAMVDYARGRGWLTDDAESIRAHIVWR